MSEAVNLGIYQSQSKRKISRASDTGEHGLEANNPTKRQRVSRACDQCRNIRAKCDGGQPTCKTCSSAGRTCTYVTTPKKRGIQAGYVRSLELTLAWLLTNNTGARCALQALLRQDDGQGQALVTGRNVAGADRLYDQWRQSAVSKGLELLLSDQEIPDELWETLDDEQSAGNETSGLQRDSAFAPGPVTRPFDSAFRPDPCSPTDPVESESGISPLHDGDPGPQSSHLSSLTNNNSRGHRLSKLDAPKDWRLLDIYFSFTHSWFPIAEKSSLLRTANSYPEDGLQVDPNLPGSGDHAELCAVLALASYQQLKAAQKDPHAGNNAPTVAGENASQPLFRIALGLVNLGNGMTEVGHIRALLLLSLLLLYQLHYSEAWVLIGFATRLLLVLKPDIDAMTDSLKRAAMGCVILDTILSARLGKTPYLRKGDIACSGFRLADGLDEWQAWNNSQHGSGDIGSQIGLRYTPGHTLSIFSALAELVGLSGSALEDSQTHQSPETSQSLREWETRLPQGVKLDSARLPSTVTPQLLLLHSVSSSIITRLEQPNQLDNVRAKQKFASLCELYATQFGFAFMPPIHRLLFKAVQLPDSVDTEFESRVASLISRFDACHSSLDGKGTEFPSVCQISDGLNHSAIDPDPLIPSPFGNSRSALSAKDDQRGDRNSLRDIGSHLEPLNTAETIEHEAHEREQTLRDLRDSGKVYSTDFGAGKILSTDLSTPARIVQNHDGPSSNLPDGIDSIAYTALAGTSPTDLDALFDDLMDTDSIQGLEMQSDFMQNLGFGPSFTSPDTFFEQYDPLILAHIPANWQSSSLPSSQPFDSSHPR
ncbi:hypothetical protein EV356DRAFT_530807 [Viridothelium virens]|uniref:Zn(2)-C6 fungal-type domain-containing protein n=1 Tax=Viridothelium virens TaxID=1048519 RepID=A0A6A6HEK9_VIRVR|nr:hypothetical protein EV356DRAFT_530807 [Viridothelium virens]